MALDHLADRGERVGDTWLPKINQSLCTGCGDCVVACPVDALGTVGGKAALTTPMACTYCTECEDICPTNAIELPFLICTLETDPNPHSPKETDDEKMA